MCVLTFSGVAERFATRETLVGLVARVDVLVLLHLAASQEALAAVGAGELLVRLTLLVLAVDVPGTYTHLKCVSSHCGIQGRMILILSKINSDTSPRSTEINRDQTRVM